MIRLAISLLAIAQAVSVSPANRTATLCLDPVGTNLGATCRGADVSLLGGATDICQCLNGGATVRAPYCARGETPQADTAALRRARYAASRTDGTLVGKTYQGRSFCVSRP